MRKKSVYSCSVKICASGFNQPLESIFFLLLVGEAFFLQKVVKILDDMVTSEKYAQQIHKMRWKPQHLQLALIHRNIPVPDHTSHNQAFKSWMNWATSFASFSMFSWPLTNWLPLLQASQLFEVKMLLQPAGGRNCFPGVGRILRHGFLCYRNKQTYFSLAKMCWF